MSDINTDFINDNSNINTDSITFWDFYKDTDMQGVDNLELVLGIKKHGLPDDAELRTKILTNFANDRDNQYKLDYEKLYNYSESFREYYPLDKVLYLIKKTITNMQNYIIDINHSNLSDEDKALLFFVIPM
jgi:hypothetical protein